MHWLKRGLAILTGVDRAAALSTLVPPSLEFGDRREKFAGYGWAVLASAIATGLALLLRGLLDPANLVLLYLMAVVLVAVRFGRKPGILASFLAVLTFDIFLVPPYYSLTVKDPQYLLTFAIMLIVALIISTLTAHLQYQARIAQYGERRAGSLFDLSKELSAALTYDRIIEIAVRHLDAMFQADVMLLLSNRQGALQTSGAETHALGSPQLILQRAQSVYDRQIAAALHNDSDISDGMLYLPLRAPMRTRGVLVIRPKDVQLLQYDQQRLLHTCAAQIALAIERVHYVEVAQEAEIAMESERLRNSLLSAISHDVRTPLTAIVGLASTLASSHTMQDDSRQELAEAIQEEALRMSSLVLNLLDMAKLHAGGIKLNRQWQMLEEVVGSSLGMLSRTLEGRCIEVALAPALPLLEFDAVLMERVFCNLLENAAKYTPPGSPLWIAAAQDADVVRVSVKDNGPGVPTGMSEAVFAKFTRGDSESVLTGVGLGLSICRTIVEAHGGRIWVENGNDGGAHFIFTLPVGVPPVDNDLLTVIDLVKPEGAT